MPSRDYMTGAGAEPPPAIDWDAGAPSLPISKAPALEAAQEAVQQLGISVTLARIIGLKASRPSHPVHV